MVDSTDFKELERQKFFLSHGVPTIKVVDFENHEILVAEGEVPAHSLVHKFGAATLTTTLAPVCSGGYYRTPSTAQALEVLSSSAADAAAGSGAQTVTIIGLGSDWLETSETVTLNGVTAVPLVNTYTRVYRWFVSRSGTYATQDSGSHVGSLTIREVSGGAVWSVISNTPFSAGQSQIGAYTVPKNKKAYLFSKSVFIDTTKTADIYFFQRTNADDSSTPYSGIMRLVEREVGVTGGFQIRTDYPKGPFVGPCDIGFMGKVGSGTAECSAEFELLLLTI